MGRSAMGSGEKPGDLAAGRTNQKERTRKALLAAARELFAQGQIPTVAATAQRAAVSEATAYRYYPSARSLLRDVFAVNWSGLETVLANLRATPTLEARAQLAAEVLARTVLANEAQVRALIAMSYSSSEADKASFAGELWPAFRVALISAVMEAAAKRLDAKKRRQLELALFVAISAEAVLALKDKGDCDDREIASTLGWSAYQIAFSAQHHPPKK
jgi:AcrR family transcriptional regulator